MGKFLLLAFRNIFRNRRRTIMTLIVVGGGVAGLLLAGGYFAFMTHGLRESTINNGLGHLQIFTAESLQARRSPRSRHGHRKLASGGRECLFGSTRARRCSAHRLQRHGLQRNQGRRIHGQRRRSSRGKQSRICHQCRIGQRSRFQAVRRSRSTHWNRFGQVDERQGRRWVDDTGYDFRRRA